LAWFCFVSIDLGGLWVGVLVFWGVGEQLGIKEVDK
jgi:hypothetical protein